jgi:hypothetical protein
VAVIGRVVPTVDLLLRSGDYWSARLLITDAGDHNRDGVIEDPGNPTPLNLAGYTVLAQIRPSKQSSTVLATIAVDTTNAATGILVLSLTAAQTRSINDPATSGKDSISAFYDFQVTPPAPDNDKPLTWWEGKVTDQMDVSRTP